MSETVAYPLLRQYQQQAQTGFINGVQTFVWGEGADARHVIQLGHHPIWTIHSTVRLLKAQVSDPWWYVQARREAHIRSLEGGSTLIITVCAHRFLGEGLEDHTQALIVQLPHGYVVWAMPYEAYYIQPIEINPRVGQALKAFWEEQMGTLVEETATTPATRHITLAEITQNFGKILGVSTSMPEILVTLTKLKPDYDYL